MLLYRETIDLLKAEKGELEEAIRVLERYDENRGGETDVPRGRKCAPAGDAWRQAVYKAVGQSRRTF